MKKALLFLLILPLMLGLQSCSNTVVVAPSVNKTEPYVNKQFDPNAKLKVAFFAPLSGVNSLEGRALYNSAQLAVQQNHLDNIRLIPVDSNSRSAMQMIDSNKIDIIAGPLFSSATSKVADAAAKQGISVIAFSNNPNLSYPNLYALGISLDDQMKSVINAAKQDGFNNIFMVLPENRYGDLIKNSVEVSNANISKTYYYNPSDRALGFNHIITDIQANVEDDQKNAIIFPESGANLLAFARAVQLNLAENSAVMLGSSQWDNKQIYQNNSALLSGSYYPALNHRLYDDYIANFQKSFGYNPPAIAALGYDAILIISQMLEALRTKNSTIIDATVIEGQNLNNLITGPLMINSNNNVTRALKASKI